MAKTTHTTDTSRRAILGGAGILAALTVAPVAAKAAQLSDQGGQISPRLTALIAQFAAADDTLDRFYQATFNPAVDRHNAMLSAIPHIVRDTPALAPGGQDIHWTTANPHTIAHAAGIAKASQARSNQSLAWQ